MAAFACLNFGTTAFTYATEVGPGRRHLWRVAGRQSGSPELLESPWASPEVPELPRKFPSDFPGSSLTVESSSNPDVPRKFPGDFPGSLTESVECSLDTSRRFFSLFIRKLERRLWLSEIPCWKGFPANFDAAGKCFPDFPAAQNAIPAKVWALSGKEKQLLENWPRLRERCWIFSSETATTFLRSSEFREHKISPKFFCPIFFVPALSSWTSARSGHGCPHTNACFFASFRGPARSF